MKTQIVFIHFVSTALTLSLLLLADSGSVVNAQLPPGVQAPKLPQYGGLKVWVRDATNNAPVPNAEVCLIGQTPWESAVKYTNQQGIAEFTAAPTSFGQVIAAANGYVGQRKLLNASKNPLSNLSFSSSKTPTFKLAHGNGGPRCPKKSGGGSSTPPGSGTGGGIGAIPTNPIETITPRLPGAGSR